MRPTLPEPVDRATERVFCALSAARGRRIFHPAGIAFRARVTVHTGIDGTTALPPGETVDAVMRFSRGLGTPSPAPDFLGVAVHLATEQDLLLVSSAASWPLRFAPIPARDAFEPFYTSLLPFRVAAGLLLVGARVRGTGAAATSLVELADQAPLRIALGVAEPRGPWRLVAELATVERLPPAEAASLAFDAWRCEGGLVPWSAVNRLRAPAYRGSRRGRTRRCAGAAST